MKTSNKSNNQTIVVERRIECINISADLAKIRPLITEGARGSCRSREGESGGNALKLKRLQLFAIYKRHFLGNAPPPNEKLWANIHDAMRDKGKIATDKKTRSLHIF